MSRARLSRLERAVAAMPVRPCPACRGRPTALVHVTGPAAPRVDCRCPLTPDLRCRQCGAAAVERHLYPYPPRGQ